MEKLPNSHVALLLRLRVAEAEALIAECEPIIAHYASIEAQLASQQNPAPPLEPANPPPAGLPAPHGTAAEAGPR